ncbi:MAG: AAA family ATPase, partial [Clostridia bacterium]|nr:AAA family ATPase [Clostridia bacterium]
VEQIMSMNGDRHVILLSGPSGSGKTTTAKKLADEFKMHDIDVQLISMDDFYLGIDYVCKTPDGKPDFECVEALDIPLIRKTIEQLAETGECTIPKYDFTISQRSSETQEIKLSRNSVIIIEGIHALNPIFSDGMPVDKVVKVYVSVKQGIKSGEDYVLTNRDIRFLRRVVRDYSFRKVPPENMLEMWPVVCEGEVKYIRPYRYTSDFTVNSIHIYEPCIMKNTALELLQKIQKDNPSREYTDRLIQSLMRFESIDSSLIPENSLIREFIGGGCYIY